MGTTKSSAVAVLLFTAAIGMAGCSAGTASPAASGDSGSKVLNVWLMQNTLTPDSQKEVIAKFEKQTGATVNLEIQQWDNINTKVTTALATDTPPDVLEIGNTDVPLFAAAGGLMDISGHQDELQGSGHWITGLSGPATVDGKLFAMPFYGGSRAIIYNTRMWKDAGITAPPKTFPEFQADLAKVGAKYKAPGFSPIYLTGTNWYAATTFIADAAGTGSDTFAKQSGGTWHDQLTKPAAIKGLQDFKDFQNTYSTPASRTAEMNSPDPNSILGTGKTSSIFGNGSALSTVAANYPDLKDSLSAFPIPSIANPGEIAPSYVGGSDIAISAKSPHKDLAVQFLKFIASPDIQLDQLTIADGHTPNTTELLEKASGMVAPNLKEFFVAAEKSFSTPASAGWSTIETDNSVANFYSTVAAGTSSPEAAAKEFSDHLVSSLNKAQ